LEDLISERQIIQVRFLGAVTGRDIYQTFEEDGGAMPYDRNAIRNDIASMISLSEIVVLTTMWLCSQGEAIAGRLLRIW